MKNRVWDEVRGGVFVCERSELEGNNLCTDQLVKLPDGRLVSWRLFEVERDFEHEVYEWRYRDEESRLYCVYND